MSLEQSYGGETGQNSLRSYKNSPNRYQMSNLYQQQFDSDPFKLNSLQEVFQGVSDWRNIQDIIRQTFRGMFDTLKLQGDYIQSIDQQLSQKVSKQEFQNSVSQKANSFDVNRSFADIMQSLDTKLSYDECKVLLKEEQGISEKNVLIEVNQKIDEQQIFHNRQLQTEIQIIQQQLLTKPNLTEMTELLEAKVNKQQFQTALSKKVDKVNLEEQLSTKLDKLEHMQTLNILENKAEISQVEKLVNILEIKADKSDFDIQNKQLRQIQDEIKLKFKDFQNSYERLEQDIEKCRYDQSSKLDISEFNKMTKQVSSQSSKLDLLSIKNSELQNEIDNLQVDLKTQKKANENAIYQKNIEDDQQFQQIRDEIQKVNNVSKNVTSDIKRDIEASTALIKNVSNAIKQDIIRETQTINEEINKFRQEYHTNKIDLDEYNKFQDQVFSTLKEKTDLDEVQAALNTCQKDISQRFLDLKQSLEKQLKLQESQLIDQLQRKVTVHDMHELLSQKADLKMIESALVVKANRKEVDQVRDEIQILYGQIEQKLDVSEYQSTFKDCMNDLTQIRQELVQKADYTITQKMVAEKADFEELQNIARDLKFEMDRKAQQDTLNRMLRDQAIINESLCTENIIGRWMWKSGHVKTGSLVPWELQIVNTLPDNFLWEKDKSSILVCAPGLYELVVGFFSLKKPGIQVQINGEPILSAVQKQQESSKLKQHKHSQGQLTGLNIREVIIMPQRSRISIMYNGDSTAEGFISLKRL